MTARVRLSRAKGYRKPTDSIVVARPTLFGNPWEVGKHGTRAEVVGNYALLLLGVVAVCRDPDPEEQLEARAHVMANLDKIKAAPALACWCSLDGPCHADALIALAHDDRQTLIDLAQPALIRPGFSISFNLWNELAAAKDARQQASRKRK